MCISHRENSYKKFYFSALSTRTGALERTATTFTSILQVK